METIAIFEVLRRHAFLIASLCIITTLAGYGVSFISPLVPEKYEASAVVLVRPHEQIRIEPSSAFCSFCVPGVSTYPFPGFVDMWLKELGKHGNPPWASSEGTAMDPREARQGGRGIGMEGYLGTLFNHGAVLVNVFGWGEGDESNPFRRIAEGSDALAAYRKFLDGEKLGEAHVPDLLSTLPANLRVKIQKVQAAMPVWIQAHGPTQIQDNIESLGQALENKRFNDAEKITDTILKKIGQ
jgi:hypothetical protein